MSTDEQAQAFNPLDPDLIGDPYPIYKRARQAESVQYVESMGLYALLSYDAARSLVRNHEAEPGFEDFQRRIQGDDVVNESYFKTLRHWVLFQHGDAHKRMRDTFRRQLTPSRVEEMRPEMSDRASKLVDGFVDDGEVDLMSAFARQLPLGTISELLGVPDDAHDQLLQWLSAFQHVVTFIPMNDEQLKEGNEAIEGLDSYFSDLIAEKRKNPQDDLLTALISEADEGNLEEHELVVNAWGLYFAGEDTTTNAMGNALVTLFEHPDQMDRLRSDLSLIPGAVEELIRYRHPAQANVRILREDTQIEDKTIEAGTAAVFYIPSANRDEKQFTDPETFDITREIDQSMNFGGGRHVCPGQHVARATLTVALEQLLTRLPGLRLDIAMEDIEWLSSPILQGPVALPVKWDPEN